MTIVGRKRLNAVITDARGSSTRGNAVLRISAPPPTTERTAWRIASVTKLKTNRHAIRWAKNLAPPVRAARMSTSTKNTNASSSGLSTSQSCPNTVL